MVSSESGGARTQRRHRLSRAWGPPARTGGRPAATGSHPAARPGAEASFAEPGACVCSVDYRTQTHKHKIECRARGRGWAPRLRTHDVTDSRAASQQRFRSPGPTAARAEHDGLQA